MRLWPLQNPDTYHRHSVSSIQAQFLHFSDLSLPSGTATVLVGWFSVSQTHRDLSSPIIISKSAGRVFAALLSSIIAQEDRSIHLFHLSWTWWPGQKRCERYLARWRELRRGIFVDPSCALQGKAIEKVFLSPSLKMAHITAHPPTVRALLEILRIMCSATRFCFQGLEEEYRQTYPFTKQLRPWDVSWAGPVITQQNKCDLLWAGTTAWLGRTNTRSECIP
jgi:hypothetical protein